MPTTLTWAAPRNTALSQSDQLNNAQIIANFFSTWTPTAISALCGNMHIESAINPNRWQIGYDNDPSGGFGLVQWTPATKLQDWAAANNLDYTQGDTQLQRIAYEIANNIQWYSTTDYPLTFQEFTQSNQSTDYLTDAFMHNYERPGSYSSLPDRQAFAATVLSSVTFGNGGGGGVTPPPRVQVLATPTKHQQEKTYTVKPGDTLTKIAKLFQSSISAIATRNKIKDSNVISIGQVLYIPLSDKSHPSNPTVYYVVKKGDNLSKIAKKFKTNVVQLQTWNHIKNPNLIHPNDRIRVQ
jgi:LysM repeat protein